MNRWILTLSLSLLLLGYGCDMFLEEYGGPRNSPEASEPDLQDDNSIISSDAGKPGMAGESSRIASAHPPERPNGIPDTEEPEAPVIDASDGTVETSDKDSGEECGNGRVSEAETCDTAIDQNMEGACPTECPPATGCTSWELRGLDCQVECIEVTTVDCINDDGCCPDSCNDDDNDCNEVICGDGIVSSPQETCDPPDSCPTSCQTDDDCETVSMIGDPDMCTAECVSQPILQCRDDDGCCLDICTLDMDNDCICGDGIITSPQETCDPPDSCPTSCQPSHACEEVQRFGNPINCTAVCDRQPITRCVNGDGCCLEDTCNSNTDTDCPVVCGDGVVTPPETCDPPSSCPIDCTTDHVCQFAQREGDPASCTATCTIEEITRCVHGDGCCPDNCDIGNDDDCDIVCGDEIVTHPTETCDPPSTCPVSCTPSNSCERATLKGDPENCNAVCEREMITQCINDDQCCPERCTVSTDNDCPVVCGDGIISSPQETCDPPSSCPTSCAPNHSCDIAFLDGDPNACTAVCIHDSFDCLDGDGCCPENCTPNTDDDCRSF